MPTSLNDVDVIFNPPDHSVIVSMGYNSFSSKERSFFLVEKRCRDVEHQRQRLHLRHLEGGGRHWELKTNRSPENLPPQFSSG